MPQINSFNPIETNAPPTSRFQKGTSGNPAGRPPGSRNKSTRLMEQLLEGDAEAIIRKAVELAKNGDTVMLRLCMDRIAPRRKERLVEFPLPDLSDPQNLPAATESILKAVSKGAITPGEAESLARTVWVHRALVKGQEFDRRMGRVAPQPLAANEAPDSPEGPSDPDDDFPSFEEYEPDDDDSFISSEDPWRNNLSDAAHIVLDENPIRTMPTDEAEPSLTGPRPANSASSDPEPDGTPDTGPDAEPQEPAYQSLEDTAPGTEPDVNSPDPDTVVDVTKDWLSPAERRELELRYPQLTLCKK